MRLEGIQAGDIVEVAHRSGRRFLGLVTGPVPGGLAVKPLDRRVSYYSCRAREVVVHWARKGRPRATEDPAEPSVGQLEPRQAGDHAHLRGAADDAPGRRPAAARADRRARRRHPVRDDRPAAQQALRPSEVDRHREAQNLNCDYFEYLRHLHDDPPLASRCCSMAATAAGKSSREPMLHSRIYRRVAFRPLSDPDVLALMPRYHPIYTHVDAELLVLINDTAANGRLRSWASFTHTASKMCRAVGAEQIDHTIARNAIAQLGHR